MVIYLARPIDAAKDDPKLAYKHLADAILSHPDTEGVVIYCPALAFAIANPIDSETCAAIVAINTRAVQMSDMVILEYLPGVPSFGVPQEIKEAHDNNVPVWVLSETCPYEDLPVNLKAYVGPDYVFDDLGILLDEAGV